MLRNMFIGLAAGTLVGIFAGWCHAGAMGQPTAHNLGALDRIVTAVSIGFVCFSIGGLAGVFWPIPGNQRQPALAVRLAIALAISIPGDVVAGFRLWEAYQEGLQRGRKPDYKPAALFPLTDVHGRF